MNKPRNPASIIFELLFNQYKGLWCISPTSSFIIYSERENSCIFTRKPLNILSKNISSLRSTKFSKTALGATQKVISRNSPRDMITKPPFTERLKKRVPTMTKPLPSALTSAAPLKALALVIPNKKPKPSPLKRELNFTNPKKYAKI